MYVQHFQQSMYAYGSTGYGCQSCSWSAEQGKLFFFRPHSWLRINLVYLARGDGFGRPSRSESACSFSTLRLNLVLTHGILRAFRDGVHLYGQPPWGQSQVFQVAQLRADDIHCLESAGTELVDLKVFE